VSHDQDRGNMAPMDGAESDMKVFLELGRYDAVLFDMDGVVTDTAPVHEAAWKRTFDQFLSTLSARAGGVRQPPFTGSDYLKYVDGKRREDGVVSFLTSRGIDLPLGSAADPPGTDTVWALASRKDHDFGEVLANEGARAFPTTVALVRDLRRAAVRTAIISGSRHCGSVLVAAGVGDLFDVRVDGVESERLGLASKPSPAVFLEAARRLDAVPSRAVVVEDAIAGVQAGRAGRFGLVIGVDRIGHADALRANGADVVVADLAEVQLIGAS
jgi:alpha,alpha-trehalase